MQQQVNELDQTFTMSQLQEAFEYAKSEWEKEISMILKEDKV